MEDCQPEPDILNSFIPADFSVFHLIGRFVRFKLKIARSYSNATRNICFGSVQRVIEYFIRFGIGQQWFVATPCLACDEMGSFHRKKYLKLKSIMVCSSNRSNWGKGYSAMCFSRYVDWMCTMSGWQADRVWFRFDVLIRTHLNSRVGILEETSHRWLTESLVKSIAFNGWAFHLLDFEKSPHTHPRCYRFQASICQSINLQKQSKTVLTGPILNIYRNRECYRIVFFLFHLRHDE